MSLPEFNELGYLPEGDHEASWEEIESRYGYNRRRREILSGLRHVVERLEGHGVELIWLNGSFTTDKQRPSDVDVVYKISPGRDRSDWPDVGRGRRDYVKQNFRVDLWRFPSPQPLKNSVGTGASTHLMTIKQFFESDGDGNPKGMVRLLLRSQDNDQEREAAEDRADEA